MHVNTLCFPFGAFDGRGSRRVSGDLLSLPEDVDLGSNRVSVKFLWPFRQVPRCYRRILFTWCQLLGAFSRIFCWTRKVCFRWSTRNDDRHEVIMCKVICFGLHSYEYSFSSQSFPQRTVTAGVASRSWIVANMSESFTWTMASSVVPIDPIHRDHGRGRSRHFVANSSCSSYASRHQNQQSSLSSKLTIKIFILLTHSKTVARIIFCPQRLLCPAKVSPLLGHDTLSPSKTNHISFPETDARPLHVDHTNQESVCTILLVSELFEAVA